MIEIAFQITLEAKVTRITTFVSSYHLTNQPVKVSQESQYTEEIS
jgi:hypothetical protein